MIHNKKIKFAGATLISIFVLISCNKESPTVLLPDIIGSAIYIEYGYNYPVVFATYPQTTATLVPVNSTFVIVFNEPILASTLTLAGNIVITSTNPVFRTLVNGVDYNITPALGNTKTAKITFSYGGVNPLMPGDNITVTINNGITDPDGIQLRNIPPLLMPYTLSFQTGTAPDITQPYVILAPDSRIPANGSANITLSPAITVDFTKGGATAWDIDVTTFNSDNFFLREQGSGIVFPTDNPSTDVTLYTSPTGTTRRAALRINAPNRLSPGTIYEVVVNAGATGVKDLAGNELTGGTTWSFTTIATPYDPYGGLPAITVANPLTVNSVNNGNAYITWGTTKPTTYTLRYGRGDSLANSVQDLVNFLSFRSVTLTPGAPSFGKRYWISLGAADYHDILGNAGTNSSGAFQFNTTTNDAFTTVSGGAGNQSTAYTLSQASLGGVFVFWTNDNSGLLYLYGQKYTSALGTPWGSVGTGIPLFTPGASYNYSHAAEDGAGGVVLMAANGTNVYAKRVLTGGTFDDWGDGGGTAANTAGLQINTTAGASNGTNAAVEDPSSGLLDRVLYAWQQAGAPTTIKAAVLDLTGTPPTIDVTEFTLDNGQTPFVIPDGTAANEAIVIYVNSGKIYGHKIDGNGLISWGSRASHVGTANLSAGTGTPAYHEGVTDLLHPPWGDLSGGFNWASTNTSYKIANDAGPLILVWCNQNTTTITQAVTHINNQMIAAGVTGFTAYNADGTHIGFRSNQIGTSASMNLNDAVGTSTPSTMSILGIGTYMVADDLHYYGTGVGWTLTPQSFTISINGSGTQTITLDADCTTLTAVVTLINTKLVAAFGAGVKVEAFLSGNNVGLRTLSTGAIQTFTLGAGAPNALATLGMTAGTYTGTADPLTSHANGESIIDVQSDRAGGAVIMYRYNSGVNNVLVQRVDSTGAVNLAGWGANGYSTVVGAASTQEVMSCINTPVDGVIMAANMSNVIRAVRVGSSSWAGVQICPTINGEIQQNPQVYINGADTLITWGDNRFSYTSASTGYAHNTGWGIFGMMVNSATFLPRNVSWTANATGIGAPDYNGVAVILNNTMFTSPTLKVAPYSSGSQALLLWEDQRLFQGSDILFINLNTFSPQL
jgi:hypothetical protein